MYDYNGNQIDTAQKESPFKNKKMVCFGDSLTEQNFQYTKGWHKWVQEILGISSYTNKGKSGDTSQGVYYEINEYQNGGESLVFIMHGSNDTYMSKDTETTNVANICALARSKFQTAKIVYITPHYQTKYQKSGVKAVDIREIILETVPRYSISVYDNYQFMNLYEDSLSIYTNDNCHWNDRGHEIVGKNIAYWLLSNVGSID